MYRSRVVRAELERTREPKQRSALQADYEALDKIPKDERVLGFCNTQDKFGGFISYPMVSDYLNETHHKELVTRGLSEKDAHHITHAIGNQCDVFLTRDEGTIIKPHRQWLEENYPPLKIRLPSELVAERKVL